MSSSAPPPAAPTACPNCEHALEAPSLPFCPACGQETRVLPPSLREFALQFGGAYFSTEGAMWRTLKLLLMRPGELTVQYLAGRRKRYVLPLRLYLTVSLLVLLLMRMLGPGGPLRADIKPEHWSNAPGVRDFTPLQLGDLNERRGIGVKDGVFFCNSVPQWVCRRVQRRFNAGPEALVAEIDAFQDRVLSNLGGAMFLVVPSLALWLKLAYLHRRMGYTEHLVFALHVQTYLFLALVLVIAGGWLAPIGIVAMPVYTFLAMRRVYGGRWWPCLLREVLVAQLYAGVVGLALMLAGWWSLLF